MGVVVVVVIERIVFFHAIVFDSGYYITCSFSMDTTVRELWFELLRFCKIFCSISIFVLSPYDSQRTHKSTQTHTHRVPFVCHKIKFFAWFAFDWFLSAAAVTVVDVDVDVFLLLLCDALVSCLFCVYLFLFIRRCRCLRLYTTIVLQHTARHCTFGFCVFLHNHTNNSNPFNK